MRERERESVCTLRGMSLGLFAYVYVLQLRTSFKESYRPERIILPPIGCMTLKTVTSFLFSVLSVYKGDNIKITVQEFVRVSEIKQHYISGREFKCMLCAC